MIKNPSHKKILNDPVHGFINVLSGDLFDVIEHPYFQRLRRIKQLGLTYFVYPGALHTRFHHTLGATHLMSQAIEVLQQKNEDISIEETLSAQYAILLHDIGHGPFSHALEHTIIKDLSHEILSSFLMDEFNTIFDGKLNTAIRIFNDEYPKKFLHQLVSSNIDVDRLDYLKRDSFFTGVSEGVISSERIIKMLKVNDGQIVVEAKGLHSVENFLISRELMYWQVYLHKTVIAAEQMLVKVLQRAKELAMSGVEVFATPAFKFFLYENIVQNDLLSSVEFSGGKKKVLEIFSLLDDYDIMTSMKVWCFHSDKILSDLSSRLVNRRLFKIQLQRQPIDEDVYGRLAEKIVNVMDIDESEVSYYLVSDKIETGKQENKNEIMIYFSDDNILPLSQASEILSKNFFMSDVTKYFICYPKEIIPKAL